MGKNKGIKAPRLGAGGKPVKASKSSKSMAERAPVREGGGSGKVYVCKMGENQVEVDVVAGDKVLDVLRKATFPEGTFKTAAGGSIRNLIEAAENEVSRGNARNLAACFQDLRVDAAPAQLDTPVRPNAVITLVPNIRGGLL